MQLAHQTRALPGHTLPPAVRVFKSGLLADLRPAADQAAPVARGGGRGDVPVAEGAQGVVDDALRLVRVVEVVGDLLLEVGEVALDLDVVLLRARGDEQILERLDPGELVGEDERTAVEQVF